MHKLKCEWLQTTHSIWEFIPNKTLYISAGNKLAFFFWMNAYRSYHIFIAHLSNARCKVYASPMVIALIKLHILCTCIILKSASEIALNNPFLLLCTLCFRLAKFHSKRDIFRQLAIQQRSVAITSRCKTVARMDCNSPWIYTTSTRIFYL